LQNWENYKDVKSSEIEVKAQKLLDSIIKVETTAAKSIKNYKNIKF